MQNKYKLVYHLKGILFSLFIFLIWFLGWGIGGTVTIVSLFSDGAEEMPIAFFIMFPIMWFIPTLFVGRILWWFIFGKEIIKVESNLLNLEKAGLLFSKPKSFYLSECKCFRTVENPFAQLFPFGFRTILFNGNSNGVIAFDYGMQTVKFADGIDEAEGKYVLRLLKEKGIFTEHNF